MKRLAARSSPAVSMVRPVRTPLLTDLREMIRAAREHVARAVDSGMLAHYWQIGHRIHEDILQRTRAGYGDRIVVTLSQRLTTEFGAGFSRFNLARMIQLAEAFPDRQIVATLSQQLAWSHYIAEAVPEKQLAKKLHAAVRHARAQLTARHSATKVRPATKHRDH